MTFEKNIPNATAKRLSLYYRIFKRFHRENIEKASSKQIAEAIGIDPATVRRDFSYFGELGRRGFGYDVNKLMTFFAELLNDNATTKVLLVGVGNVGRALLHYRFKSVTACSWSWLLIQMITNWLELKPRTRFLSMVFPRLRTRLPKKISKQPS